MNLDETSFLNFCYGNERPSLPVEKLTVKQRIVYCYIKAGLSPREIAEKTSMSYAAVFSHIAYIKKKGWLV